MSLYLASLPHACRILIDANKKPTHLIGLIVATKTKGRENPPDCFSGFDSTNTPFDKGHIMGLQVGGPDVTENIVPQYRFLQQSGRWSEMENDLAKTGNNGDVFACEISYDDNQLMGTQHQNQVDRYYNQLEKFNWNDRRIPTRLVVWHVRKNHLNFQQCKAGVSALNETDFKNAFNAIKNLQSHKDFDHSTMPEEDVYQVENLQIGHAMQQAFQSYEDEWEDDTGTTSRQKFVDNNNNSTATPMELQEAFDVTRSPRRDDIEFTITEPELIKQELEQSFGWSPTQRTALNGGRIAKASLAKSDLLGRNRKAQQMRYVRKRKDFLLGRSKKNDWVTFKNVKYPASKKKWPDTL